MIKPKLLKVEQNKELSFGIRHEKVAYFDNPWHYHPEFEVTLVTNSTGIRFVGDSIERFEGGDLVLLGPNLPHYWRNSEEYYNKDCYQYAEAYILRFKAGMVESILFEIPEMAKIDQLLRKASQGLWFEKTVALDMMPLFQKILEAKGAERILGFLQVLHHLSMTAQCRMLSTKTFNGRNFQADSERIDKALNYIARNLEQKIFLYDIAAHVNMNSTAFCRYIKSHTGKTFVELLNDIRIANACRLLLDSKKNIAEISYQCGFSTVTHFNYIFKQVTAYNPSDYRKKMS